MQTIRITDQVSAVVKYPDWFFAVALMRRDWDHSRNESESQTGVPWSSTVLSRILGPIFRVMRAIFWADMHGIVLWKGWSRSCLSRDLASIAWARHLADYMTGKGAQFFSKFTLVFLASFSRLQNRIGYLPQNLKITPTGVTAVLVKGHLRVSIYGESRRETNYLRWKLKYFSKHSKVSTLR